MPRYFFHVYDGQTYTDIQGDELPDLTAAKREAVRFAGALLSDKPDEFWSADQWEVRVTDEQDMTLFELHFMATDSPSIQRG